MIEIKNLVVRVVEANDTTRRGATMGGGPTVTTPLTDEDRAALIEDCVRQVLAILERQTQP
ncbi:DUF5908 family protein [Spirosoma areae]